MKTAKLFILTALMAAPLTAALVSCGDDAAETTATSAAGPSGSGGEGGNGSGSGSGGGSSSGSGSGGAGGSSTGTGGTLEIPIVRVKNGCPFPLWIHGEGQQGVLQPDDAKLETGQTIAYSAPAVWTSARVTAYLDGPKMNEIDKVEMTFDTNGGVQNLNYNITYVDWVGLPSETTSLGSGPDCKKVSCDVKASEVLSGCPAGLLDGKKCLSPRTYCSIPQNKNTPLCQKLDAKVNECVMKYADCAGAAGLKSPEVYACTSGTFFGQSPKWCAAINRGMLDNAESSDTSLYYKNEPYNSYSKWVHEVCPGIYAFPYDDYPSGAEESGFHSCSDGTELQITFCPAG